MTAEIKIWDGDHTELVQQLMNEIPLDAEDIVRRVITAAYAAGYEKYSDGITLMPELEFGGFRMKNPVGVGHDWLYYLGMENPFLPKSVKTEWQARLWCDNWFDDGLKKFGHPFRAPFWWFGLRVGGWWSWHLHRVAGHPHGLGWIKDRHDSRDRKFSVKYRVPLFLPAHMDLRASCSAVEDQGNLGSCTAQALVGALEYLEFKTGLPFSDLSRLFVYYNERSAEETVDEDAGAELRTGIKVLAALGVCRESLWPYDIERFTEKPPTVCYAEADDHQIISYQRLETLDEMRACLAMGMPFVFGFQVYKGAMSSAASKTGDIPMPGRMDRMFSRSLGGHAVMAVGYDDVTQRVSFRNSWGSAWGKDGYGTLPYAYLENRNLSDDFWTIQRTECDVFAKGM